MNVLSLFDGISVGLSALKKLGIPVEKYFASEIDKYAIQISKKNHPEIIHVGDVKNLSYTGKNKIDLLIGGSPCQGFSYAGLGLNFEDPRSKLFFEYARILKEIRKYNPDVKFMLENVLMTEANRNVISEALGVEPIKINSSLVSAQNRRRFYWTNIEGVTQPADRGILLSHILENHLDRGVIKDRGEKSQCLDASYFKGVDNHGQRTMILSGIIMHDDKRRPNQEGFRFKNDKAQGLGANYGKGPDTHGQRTCVLVGMVDGNGHDINRRVYDPEGKAPTLLSKSTGGQYPPKIFLSDEQVERAKKNYDSKVWPTGKRTGALPFPDSTEGKSKTLVASATLGNRQSMHIKEGYRIRMLTPVECERLQGLPDGYTAHGMETSRKTGRLYEVDISNTQRYKALGNGWQRDTVEHIFSFLPSK